MEEYAKRLLRVTETEEAATESEIIHVRMETIPPINIIGEYLETNQSSDKNEKTHKILTEKVQRRVDAGENSVIMGDMNAAVNPDCRQLKPAARLILTGRTLSLHMSLT